MRATWNKRPPSLLKFTSSVRGVPQMASLVVLTRFTENENSTRVLDYYWDIISVHMDVAGWHFLRDVCKANAKRFFHAVDDFPFATSRMPRCFYDHSLCSAKLVLLSSNAPSIKPQAHIYACASKADGTSLARKIFSFSRRHPRRQRYMALF